MKTETTEIEKMMETLEKYSISESDMETIEGFVFTKTTRAALNAFWDAISDEEKQAQKDLYKEEKEKLEKEE